MNSILNIVISLFISVTILKSNDNLNLKKMGLVCTVGDGIAVISGLDNIKEAFYMLKYSTKLNFVGFIEGNEIGQGKVDVVVCDGFRGE